MDYSNQARCLFEQGYNCAQAVFLAFADVVGFEPEPAARLTSCLGGGFSGTGGICGAVSGACLVLSARFGREDASREGVSLERQQHTGRLVRELQDAFAAEFGHTDCPGLLECGFAASGGKDGKHLCSRYVEMAAQLAGEAMEKHGIG